MAAKNGSGRAHQIQHFMKEQVEEAQKRILAIEGEAKKALENLVEKGKESRRELQGALKRFNAKELKFLENPSQVVKAFQSRLIQVSGIASQSQLKDLNKELHRLAKKVDGLIEKKAKPEARA